MTRIKLHQNYLWRGWLRSVIIMSAHRSKAVDLLHFVFLYMFVIATVLVCLIIILYSASPHFWYLGKSVFRDYNLY